MADEIDLIADLNAEDDDGLGWSTLADASDPERVVPGAWLLAGNRYGQAVVRIVAVAMGPFNCPTTVYFRPNCVSSTDKTASVAAMRRNSNMN